MLHLYIVLCLFQRFSQCILFGALLCVFYRSLAVFIFSLLSLGSCSLADEFSCVSALMPSVDCCCYQACCGYGYPWIYPCIYPCVDIRLQPSCGYIHGYCAVAFAN